jgi:hypothetical protein
MAHRPGFRSSKGGVFDKGGLPPPLPVTSHRDAVEAGDRSEKQKRKEKAIIAAWDKKMLTRFPGTWEQVLEQKQQ